MSAASPSSTTANPASQTMSQSDVERLLAMVGGGEAGGAEVSALSGEGSSGPMLVSRYEFPQLSSFSADQLQKLRTRCESFMASLTSRLSSHLRLECGLQMTKLETVRYQQFVNGLPGPTFLTLFKVEPMAGVCLLDIPSRLALALVDRELGGPAVCEEEGRDLTAIEAKLAGRMVQLIVSEWCNTWADTFQLRPMIIRNETSGRFLQTSSSETFMLSLGIEAKLGQSLEQVQMAFPQSILDPLLHKLSADLQSVEKAATAQPAAASRWNPLFNDIPVELVARWHAAELSAREVAGLKVGDVVPLRQNSSSQVELTLDAQPKFAGVLGASGRKLAVKVMERV